MKISCTIIAVLFLATSCSSQYGITRSKAFVQESIAGTVRVDDNGRPMNSGVTRRHLIYVETNATKASPLWKMAWVEGKPYSVQVISVQPGQTIGKTKDGKSVQVNASAGDKLWQLVLTPSSSTMEKSLSKKIAANKIVLTGTWKNKQITYVIKGEDQLQSIFNQ